LGANSLREHMGEIGLILVFFAIVILLIPSYLGFGGTWSLLLGIWLGIAGIFFMRAERSREAREERREERQEQDKK